MELQVIMDASSETLNSLWMGHSPPPSYQQQSPPAQPEERDVITTQPITMSYRVSDNGELWPHKIESPKHLPNVQLNSNAGSRGNAPTSEQQSISGASNRLKRCCTEANPSVGELHEKHARREGLAVRSELSLWYSRQVEELAEHFVDNFDESLSGLTANELHTVTSYDMSEALLTIPPLSAFKQEAPSPGNHANYINLNHVAQRNLNGQHQNVNMGLPVEPDSNTNSNNGSATTTTNTTTAEANSSDNGPTNTRSVCNGGTGDRGQSTINLHELLYSGDEEYPPTTSNSSSGNHVSSSQQGYEFNEDSRFQYVLAAATSIATKLTEETLTYLNQGQSYEIKLKKLGDLSAYRGKILKSSIRICFHDRRLQYKEKEQMLSWQTMRPGERLLEIDIPLSYGMVDVSQSTECKNSVDFIWDPTKEVGIYIKVNCISTEFTAKKHGGEKGVPFRIQVETAIPNGQRLHAASCQIKVFKLKGAERKHKQDRDKIFRRPPQEQNSYQPSYDCTVLSDIPLESSTLASTVSENESSLFPLIKAISPPDLSNVDTKEAPKRSLSSSPHNLSDGTHSNSLSGPNSPADLAPDDDAVGTVTWLRNRNFQALESNFSNYTAWDMMRLSREDLIQICGVSEGIRLYNALRPEQTPPMLTIYFGLEINSNTIWKVVHLHIFTSEELSSRILSVFKLARERLGSIQVQELPGVRLLLSNDIVTNMKDKSTYLIGTQKDSSGEKYELILRRRSDE